MAGTVPRIIHIIASAGPGSFGLGPVALNLAREQNSLGGNAELWSLDTEEDRLWAATSSGLPVDKIRGYRRTPPRALCSSREMARLAVNEAPTISLVHQHSLWTGLSRVTARLRLRHGVPSVITPHGALKKWALRKSRWKKEIVLTLYERENLKNASAFHAVGPNEIADIRGFGLSNPVAVIPNGISADWLGSSGDAGSFRERCGIPADRRIVLFLSRITPIKGLPMFLEAINARRKNFTDWHFVIAGGDEFGHLEEVRRCIAEKRLDSFVSFAGLLSGQQKRDAFASADFFVLPSYGEAAPIAILEALGAGIPVLATKASPWQGLEDHDCGWWVDISAGALADALGVALGSTQDELRRMGQKGKELVAAKYAWRKSAEMTMQLYDWLLQRGEKPAFVVAD
ncbi:MAG: glycosyltransferase [Syntrophorhabdales bacterium]